MQKLFYRLLKAVRIFTGGAILLLASCTENYLGGELGTPPNGDEVAVSFSLRDASDGKGTYAGDTFNEGAFKDDLWMLVFTDQQGVRRYYGAYKVLVGSGSGTPNARVNIPRNLLSVDFDMLFCANSSEYWDLHKTGAHPDGVFKENIGGVVERGKTLDEVLAQFVLSVQPGDTGGQSGWRYTHSTLPMFGRLFHKGGTPPSGNSYQFTNKVMLLRSMARLDVVLNYNESSNTVQGFNNFKLANVYVFNSSDKLSVPYAEANVEVNYQKDPAALLPYTVNAPTVPAGAGAIEQIYALPESPEVLGAGIEGCIFLPEQVNGALTGDVHMTRPYIVVKGYYGASNIQKVENGDATAVPSFYRLDFVDNQKKFFDILRGDKIRFNIQDVKGPGFDNIADAKQSIAANIIVEIGIYHMNSTHVIFNGQSFFGVERMALEMPREAGITYKMPVNTSADIPFGKWKLGGIDAAGGDQFKDVTENTLILPWGSDETNGRFRVEKAKDRLIITTLQNWTADATDSLLVRAANLTMRMKLTQRNVDMFDWEKGQDLLGEIISENHLSSDSFIFEAPGGSQEIKSFSSSTPMSRIVFLNPDDATELDRAPDWYTVTIVSGSLSTITVSANTTGSDRYGLFRVEHPDGMSDHGHLIKVFQQSLSTGDLLAPRMGLLARDRNVGATGSSYNLASGGTLFAASAVTGQNVCPEGWFAPTAEDVQGYFRKDNIILKIVHEGDGKEYVVAMGEQNQLYLGPLDRNNASNNPSFWGINYQKNGMAEPFLFSYSYSTAPDAVNNLLMTVNTNISGKRAYMRCVKGFRIDRQQITLDMSGTESYLDFTMLNDNNQVERIEVSPPDSPVRVSRDGMKHRFVLSANATNWTTQDRTATVTLKMADNSVRTQTLTVTQTKRLPTSVNGITIGNLIWAPLNEGVTNVQLSSNMIPCSVPYRSWEDRATMERVSVSGGPDRFIWLIPATKYVDYSYGPQGLTATVSDFSQSETDPYPLPYGKYLGTHFRARNVKCPAGWRVPSLSDWATLCKHLRVEKVDIGGGRTSLLYYASDGKELIFFPLGRPGTVDLDKQTQAYATSSFYWAANVNALYWQWAVSFETAVPELASAIAPGKDFNFFEVCNYLPGKDEPLPSYINMSVDLSDYPAHFDRNYLRCVKDK